MARDDFCIFVLTHGRPSRVATVAALRRSGYSGKIRIVIDDEDKAREGYVARYGADVLTFSKADIASRFDEGDNFKDRRSVFYARNACWGLAALESVRYFMQMDDDYSGFYLRPNVDGVIGCERVTDLDAALDLMIAYLAAIPALSIAMSQGGDHLRPPLRKCMNTFLCDVERPFAFVGRVNEDVNTYTSLGRRGDLFLTIPSIEVIPKQTQSNPGGMTDLYLDSGTYLKSFYPVMYVPSAVRIGEFSAGYGEFAERRIHHRIAWRSTVAQIVPERFRKAEGRKIAPPAPNVIQLPRRAAAPSP